MFVASPSHNHHFNRVYSKWLTKVEYQIHIDQSFIKVERALIEHAIITKDLEYIEYIWVIW